eukprot:5938931-Amphidinium_carterae.3
MDRRPSALLQPPGLQVQTRGPGFLASPILVTISQVGWTSQASVGAARLLPYACSHEKRTSGFCSRW